MKWIRFLLTLILLVMVGAILPGFSHAGQDVKFSWDSYADPDPIDGFKLYMATTPNVAVVAANLVATIPGKAITTYTQRGAPAGIKYWVLTAYQGADLESGPSNEVTYTVKLKAPSGLTNSVTLTFNKTVVTVTNAKK